MTKHLPLRDHTGSICAFALVDNEDYDLVRHQNWSLNGQGRVQGWIDGKVVKLHRVLLGLTFGDPREGDHKNRNPLDNRRSNLRIATPYQNRTNVRARNKTGLRGVSWCSTTGRWRARVTLRGHDHNLGRFDTPEEAAEVAAEFRKVHMPFSNEMDD